MKDTAPQTAGGKVLWHFTMSLDGFVAGPNNEMDWMTGFSHRPGLIDEYVETTGAILGGRTGWDQFPDASATYGGAWHGPTFVLTHHPEDAAPADGVTFLDCDPAEAVRIGLAASGGNPLPGAGSMVMSSASRSKLVSQPMHVAEHASGERNPSCRRVTRVPRSTGSRR